jgi:thiosulfate/3-mercaptopyruvate sulfurtransferase
MKYNTFLSVKESSKYLNDPDWGFVDCRFYLQEPDQGYQDYLEGHIPGAVYAHLDRDLSGAVITGKTGRHPLPDIQDIAEKLSTWGINRRTQVIAYDNLGGAFAARLWWLMRWLGHERVAVLNGGWSAWIESGNVQETQESKRSRRQFAPELQPDLLVDALLVDKIRMDPEYLLIDARSPERYWAIEENIDPVAGHIPGAVSAPFSENLDEDGYFLPDDMLKERFRNLLGDHASEKTVVYCGSGVTSAHNIIAMLKVGFDMPKLYVGSWSEWITDPARPTAP